MGPRIQASIWQLADHISVKSNHIQWLALTATATPKVQKDICNVLGFEEHTAISLPFKRENVIWWVLRTEHTIERMMSTRKVKNKGDGLIYAGTRKNTERWAERLQRHGITAQAYHAGLSPDERTSIQQQWISGKVPWWPQPTPLEWESISQIAVPFMETTHQIVWRLTTKRLEELEGMGKKLSNSILSSSSSTKSQRTNKGGIPFLK